jgi:hypothetical protein
MSEISSDQQQNSEHSITLLPAFATLKTWTQLSGVGRSTTYKLLGSKHLQARKVGNRLLIDVQHGLAFIRSQPIAEISPTN